MGMILRLKLRPGRLEDWHSERGDIMNILEMYARHGAQLIADRYGLTLEEVWSLDVDDATEKVLQLLDEWDSE